MYLFIKIQYMLKMIDEQKVMSYVPRWITEEQANAIIGK